MGQRIWEKIVVGGELRDIKISSFDLEIDEYSRVILFDTLYQDLAQLRAWIKINARPLQKGQPWQNGSAKAAPTPDRAAVNKICLLGPLEGFLIVMYVVPSRVNIYASNSDN